jgi:hypothetical protein
MLWAVVETARGRPDSGRVCDAIASALGPRQSRMFGRHDRMLIMLRTRRARYSWRVAIAVVLTATLSACGSPGTALTGDGPQPSGRVSYSAKEVIVGRTYWFAFPLLINHTGSPVTITGYQMGHLGRSLSVTFFAYSQRVHSAYDLTYQPQLGHDLSHVPNVAGKPFTIAPHSRSDIVVMAQLRLLSRASLPAKAASCVVRYTQAGHHYRQSFDCDFEVGLS